MIFVENDFYLNFKNAVKSNDEQALKVIFVDQISTLIAKNRGDILSLLSKVDISVSDNPSNEEISEKIVKKIKGNAKLRAGLAFLICENNEILAASDKSNRSVENENKEEQKDENTFSQTADAVTFVAVSLLGLVNEMNKNELDDFKNEIIRKANVKAPNFSSKSYINKDIKPKVKKNKNKWIYIGLGLALVGVGIYAYKKGWLSKKEVNV